MYSLENFYFPYRNKTLITSREFITKYDFFYENMHYKYLTGRHLLNNLLMAQLQKRSACLQNHLHCAEGTLHFPKGNAQHSIVSVLEIWKSARTRSGSKLCKVTEWGGDKPGRWRRAGLQGSCSGGSFTLEDKRRPGAGRPACLPQPWKAVPGTWNKPGPFLHSCAFPLLCSACNDKSVIFKVVIT